MASVHSELINKLNQKYLSAFYLVVIHCTILTKNESTIMVVIAGIIIFIAFFKLYKYCMFMQYPKK